MGSTATISVATGDRLLIRANAKPAGLVNGDLVDVAAVDRNGNIRLCDGRTIPPWFREFAHGYATTSHSSQGKTVDRGIVLMAEDGIAAGNLRQAYVSNSRFRESQVIYTTDKESARESMMTAGDRKLASEAIAQQSPPAGLRARWLARIAPGLAA